MYIIQYEKRYYFENFGFYGFIKYVFKSVNK